MRRTQKNKAHAHRVGSNPEFPNNTATSIEGPVGTVSIKADANYMLLMPV